MVHTRSWRSLSRFVNDTIVTIPDVFRKFNTPSTRMAVSNSLTKPAADQPLLLGQFTGTNAGVWPSFRLWTSETGSIFVIHATYVVRRFCYLP